MTALLYFPPVILSSRLGIFALFCLVFLCIVHKNWQMLLCVLRINAAAAGILSLKAGFIRPGRKEKRMSPKELLYIEDALGHTQVMVKQCEDAAAKLSDPTLRARAQQLAGINRDLFTKFYGLV